VTIGEVGAVFVPVSDQERSLDFYVGKLGFEKVADFTYGGHHRWVEVAPAGASNTIALVPPTEGRSSGGDVTRCAFACGDIEAEHRALGERGVDVDAQIAREGAPRTGLVSDDATVEDPVPAQFFFRDPDGNRFLIVQPA
jgi:catechol 2,3-dioxygenase-like lactoylglutathione lyase family enzyme